MSLIEMAFRSIIDLMSDSLDPVDPAAELDAMRVVNAALGKLGNDAKRRVLQWVIDIHGRRGASAPGAVGQQPTESRAEASAPRVAKAPADVAFAEDLPSLYSLAGPDTDAERALVCGYWLQFVQQKPDFTGQEVNDALKNLGHGVSNITSAFETLKNNRPVWVMQVRKEGTSRQARKKYRLTVEGKKAVEMALSSGVGERQ